MLMSGSNANELVNTSLTPEQLAQSLVGPGVAVTNVTFTGGSASTGSFSFNDAKVVGFSQGIVLSSGSAADVVGPNLADSTSTDWTLPGDADLNTLSGFTTYDAAVLEFDFTPTANQVVFSYVFASDEYPEWVNTPYNDVFAFMVNGTNYATVRQVAGDPNSPFVPVAVNNINNSNPVQNPAPTPMRPDLFRANYVDPNGGPSVVDLELDGITNVLTFQAPVNPGVVNHMKLAIADASDGIYDSAVFIQAGSLVSNENPVADLSLSPSQGSAPLKVTAIIEGEDPNGLALTYNINWGDGNSSSGNLDSPANDSQKTALVDHTYTIGGQYVVTLTVSNGTLFGTSVEDVDVTGGQNAGPNVTLDPVDQTVAEGELFTFTADATGTPTPTVQWQVSTDSGDNFNDIDGATSLTYSATATLADNGNLYRAVFTNDGGSTTTGEALLTVTPGDTTAPDAPGVALANDTGASPADQVTSDGTLALSGIEAGASVEYSTDAGATWSGDFTAIEGLNNVDVRQIDTAGNPSDATSFSFTLDTIAPALPGVSLAKDTGGSSSDLVTQDGTLSLAGVEPDASVEYSTDGGVTWSGAFSAVEGANTVQVRQTDLAGNVGDATTLTFTLDTQGPAAPGVALTQDTGSSSSDRITKIGTLIMTGVETDAVLEYSVDGGQTWSGLFSAVEGVNDVSVRQVDVAGNAGAATSFSFTLDTTLPTLSPTFSQSQPFLVNATGITASPNASDANGIASQSAGAVDTTTAGAKTLVCSATDVAGNTASTNVSYVVGYGLINLSPASGSTFKRKSSIPVSFQLVDANGVISDQVAAGLISSITATLDGMSPVSVKYNKKTNTFSASIRPTQLAAGIYDLVIRVTLGGVDVTSQSVSITLV